MKRTISLVLIATILLCSFAFAAQATVGQELCIITLPDGGENYVVEPYEGYEHYNLLVPAGEKFVFVVRPLGENTAYVSRVAANTVTLEETDDYFTYIKKTEKEKIYVIENVTEDLNITVDYVMGGSQAYLFELFINFFTGIIRVFLSFFEMPK